MGANAQCVAPSCRSFRTGIAARRAGRRPWRALGNPLPKRGDGRVRQLARRRHLQLGVSLSDGLNEQALIRLTSNQRRPGVAPLERRLAAIEPQPVRLLLLAVTLEAAVDQDRPHPRLEEFDRLGPKCGPGRSPWLPESPSAPLAAAAQKTTSKQIGATSRNQPRAVSCARQFEFEHVAAKQNKPCSFQKPGLGDAEGRFDHGVARDRAGIEITRRRESVSRPRSNRRESRPIA